MSYHRVEMTWVDMMNEEAYQHFFLTKKANKITEKKKLQPSEKRTEKGWQAQPTVMMTSVAL